MRYFIQPLSLTLFLISSSVSALGAEVVIPTPVASVTPVTPVTSLTPVASPSPAPSTSHPISMSNLQDFKKFRDPFKEPVISEAADTRSELERFAVTDFKVTGIITGPIRMRAMVVAPNTKTYYVAEKMKMGLRDGVVVKITTKSVRVREKIVNALGEVELFDTEIGIDQSPVANAAVH
jgi:Tfp pilus assembly protein PilP